MLSEIDGFTTTITRKKELFLNGTGNRLLSEEECTKL